MTFNTWTAGTDTVTVNGSSGADTITTGDSVSARVLAGAGDDTLIYTGTTVAASARYDGGDGTDTLQLVTSGNLSGAASDGVDGFINIEAIKFVNTSGTITATFAAAQFGSGKISTTSTITGDTGTQALIINLARASLWICQVCLSRVGPMAPTQSNQWLDRGREDRRHQPE